MESMTNITEFLTYDNVGMMTQLIISGLIVMATTQALKGKVDRFIKWISKGKVKRVNTSDFTLLVTIVQVLFVMFAVNNYPVDVVSMWLTVCNVVLLYLGCTKGFDAIFKQIRIKQENKQNDK